jgi:hypothetical protein
LPRFRGDLIALLDGFVHAVSERAEMGMRNAVTREMESGLYVGLREMKRPYAVALVEEGYRLAADEIPSKQARDWKTKVIDLPSESLIPPAPVATGERTAVADWLERTSRREARTHAEAIEKEFEKARTYWNPETQSGLTPAETAKTLLREGFARDRWYSNLIARTTSIWSMNEGAQIRYAEAGVTQEQWLATVDDRTCPYCSQMDGQVVGIKESFLPEGALLSHPEIEGRFFSAPFSVEHPPLHPFCRCTIIPVIETMVVPVAGNLSRRV